MSDYPFNMYCEFMCNDAVFMVSSAYGNTVQQDLWKALQEQAGIDKIDLPDTVENIMDTWTRQMGFPVINVTRSYNANNGATASQVESWFLFPITSCYCNLFSRILFICSKDSCCVRIQIPMTQTSTNGGYRSPTPTTFQLQQRALGCPVVMT
jgi:hypothetical protein